MAEEKTAAAGGATTEEIAALREIEQLFRDFSQVYDVHPEWRWAPQTQRLVLEVRAKLKRLDEARRRAA